MKTSEAGQTFIKSFEKFRNKMYLDQAERPTIGYGHLIGPDEYLLTTTLTLEEADRLFEQDLYFRGEMCVNNYVKVPLNQYEYDALVSLTFNIGCGNLATSTLLKKLQLEPQWIREDVADEFLRWNKVKVKGQLIKSAGLSRRREAERRMFLGLKVDLT